MKKKKNKENKWSKRRRKMEDGRWKETREGK